jgi:hypothetical protein
MWRDQIKHECETELYGLISIPWVLQAERNAQSWRSVKRCWDARESRPTHVIRSKLDLRVLLYKRTFDLHTNYSERLALYRYSKFVICTSLSVLEFDMHTI